MNIPFIDLPAEHAPLLRELRAAIIEVLERGEFIDANEVAQLENELAEFLGVARVVTVNSGTDALLLALRALDIGAGHEVIVPAYTFIATAAAVVLSGARPVFVDCVADGYLLDVMAVARAVTPRTRAIVPVHLFGQSAPLHELREIADSQGLYLIEDAAQAFGGMYRQRRIGAWGDAAAFSFYPSKNLGGLGDGGAVATNNVELAERLRRLRNHGRVAHDQFIEVGCNSRLDEIQAAALRVKLRHVDTWNAKRRSIAQNYRQQLCDLPLDLPPAAVQDEHTYNQFVIAVPQRADTRAALTQRGIATAIYYSRPCHLHAGFAALGPWPEFPVADRLAQTALALPIYPSLGDEAINAISNVLRQLLMPDQRVSASL